ncbi:MAG: hypothetical protein AAFQ90_12690 [Pseudomonadota bacterium]
MTHQVEGDVLGRAIEALIACADDLEAELRARYPEETTRQYPSEARRFERDMEAVRAARNSVREINRVPGFNWAGDD